MGKKIPFNLQWEVLLMCLVTVAELPISQSGGIDINLCDDKHFNCECGTPKRYTFQLPVKQCTYFYRWKTYCKPCNDLKEETSCALFKQCQECQAGINQCISCPTGKYGLWCAGDCLCQNGAECNQLDGSCLCLPGFTGMYCENRQVSGCDPLASIPNVQWDSTSNKVGDVATARCTSGYTLMGSKTRACTKDGSWSGQLPTCERICPFPKLGAHVRTQVNPGLPQRLVDADSKEVAKEIGFDCDPGYTLTGTHRIQCQADGTWDQEPPTCKPKLICPDPGTPVNGVREVLDDVDGAFAPGTQIKFSCNNTHFLDGDGTATCTVTGKWSSALPRCFLVTGCPTPQIPTNGKLEITKPVTMGATTARPMARMVSRVGLPPGLRLASSKAPENKLPPGYSNVESRALYSCQSIYYRLMGPSSRLCQANGRWSGQEPRCEAICGQSPEPKRPSIINGTVSDVGKWPWQVGVAVRDPNTKLWVLSCGGSLLSEDYVLTAAHCVTRKGSSQPLAFDQLRMYLGKHFRYDGMDDADVVTSGVLEIVVHYNFHPKSLDSDMALVKLRQPIKFTSRIQPVCLPDAGKSRTEDLPEGLLGTVSGWGVVSDGFASDILQEAQLPVVNRRRCEEEYNSVNVSVTLTSNMFCAGLAEGGIGTCKGDSGGPFVVKVDTNPGSRWVLEGITSWGGSKQCAVAHQYSGFLKLSNFAEWIHQFV